MRQRALILVAGLPGAGKTTLAEHLLRSGRRVVLAARCVCDDSLREPVETAPKSHAELNRYRRAGASGVVLYRFPTRDAGTDAFFTTQFMEDYSQGVLMEGDQPVAHVDVGVFVAPPLPEGVSLLRCVGRRPQRETPQELDRLEGLLRAPGGAEKLLTSLLGVDVMAAVAGSPETVAKARASMLRAVEDTRRAPPPKPAEHWAIAEGYEGIERAQVVVVNVRAGSERAGADRLLADLVRLRKDEPVLRDVLGWRGSRIPITAVVADLSDAKDPGLKKAITRIGRAFRRE
jgi:hypothetical protein